MPLRIAGTHNKKTSKESSEHSLSHADVESAYARWAPLYDWVFAGVIRCGQKAAADAINAIDGPIHVLDVGVGTGLELPLFKRTAKITGVDLSESMLEVARTRVRKQRLDNVEELAVMDAMNLRFADASFDAAVVPFVLTVVPDAQKTLDELVRVVKPGGEIVLVNHVAADKGLLRAIERGLARHGQKLGWNPCFEWSTIGNWIARSPNIELLERRSIQPLGLFTLTRLRRTP
jgi:phosphatidylethanolamine/phosphatidyl-N-methylethanolamine N-methyltransferase